MKREPICLCDFPYAPPGGRDCPRHGGPTLLEDIVIAGTLTVLFVHEQIVSSRRSFWLSLKVTRMIWKQRRGIHATKEAGSS